MDKDLIISALKKVLRKAILSHENNLYKYKESFSIRIKTIYNILDSLTERDYLVNEFDDNLFLPLAEYMTVYGHEDILITFKDGTNVKPELSTNS